MTSKPIVPAVLAATLVVLAAPVPASAQNDRDAEHALEAARDAQRDFERLRRRHFERAGWGPRGCDEHIGRFCLRHDEDDDWVRPPDPPEVVEGRDTLLAALEGGAALLPASGWLVGQRVRYALEAGRLGLARDAARECAAEPAWCAALRAFIAHHEGRYLRAERLFDRALRALSPEARCRWTDISDLLEGDDRKTWRRTECGSPERARFERRFWHLTDPSWMVPGREARSEHLARRVWGRLQEDAASGYGLSWGRDLAEITMRYGWPDGWDVAWRRNPGIRTERSIQAHRAADAQRFAVLDLTGDEGPRWELADPEPRSTWAPPFGPVRSPAGHQIARFRRIDRELVVAVADLSVEPGPDLPVEPGSEPCDRRAFLAIADDEGPLATRAAEGSGPVRLVGPPRGVARLIGFEVRCEGRPGVYRVRTPTSPPGKWLSDMLLLNAGGPAPGTLDAALAAVRRHARVRAGESIRVFWEWYGGDGPLDVTLTLTREDKGFWRKALEWTGLARRRIETTGLRWNESSEGSVAGRAVTMHLPALAEGRYRLILDVQSARLGTVSAEREIYVVP